METRAAIGTAETPAEPISGLIFSLRNRFINLAIRIPPAEAMINATRPRMIIPIEFIFRIFSGVI